MIGIHMFAVLSDGEEINVNAMVISISNGQRVLQFGPLLTPEDKAQVWQLLDNNRIKIGGDIEWNAVELSRLLDRDTVISPLRRIKDCSTGFKIWQFIRADENRSIASSMARSKFIARQHALGLSAWHALDMEDPIRIERKSKSVAIMADSKLIERYAEALPLFRMQWFEIQDVTANIEGYELSTLDTTESDQKKLGQDSSRFRLMLSDWATHITAGTKLTVVDLDQNEYHAVINSRVKRKVIFSINVNLNVSDISDLIIDRGEEAQIMIRNHMKLGVKLLCGEQKAQPGGIQFCAHTMHLPVVTRTEYALYISSEVKRCQESALGRRSGMHAQTWSRFRNKQRNVHRKGMEEVSAIKTSSHFTSLNPEQQECVDATDPVVICQGYPGTGKTRTLAAYVAKRFETLLKQKCGWILCLAHTNSATLRTLTHLNQYPPLRPFLRHSYSEAYAAFHPADFMEFKDYRVTPKMILFNHGILACTIGSFLATVNRFKGLSDQIFDVVIDESGQIWEFDALVFLSRLPSVTRCVLFGDEFQLTPYVTKLMNQTFPSLNAMFQQDGHPSNTPHIIRLRTQYRMNPEICGIHAPIFYDYPIVSHRQGPTNPDSDGLFWERLPNKTELGDVDFAEYDIQRSLAIFQEIQDMKLLDSNGNAYTICILTPYKLVVTRLQQQARQLNLVHFKARTIDSVQGTEENAVILTTSRQHCVDLCQSRHRINVATSRAKDILVVMAHKATVVSVDPLNARLDRRLRHWGKFAYQARLYTPSDATAVLLQSTIAVRKRILEKGEEIMSTKRTRSAVHSNPPLRQENKFMALAAQELKVCYEYIHGMYSMLCIIIGTFYYWTISN